MCNLIFKLNFKKNQWSFLVPLMGGRWYIIPQLAIYKWYILPIGWLYGTYHLLREPETAIERNNWPKLWVFCLTGDHFHGNFPENQIWMWTKKGSEISGKRWTDSINQFRSTYFDQQQKIHPKHLDFFRIPTLSVGNWNYSNLDMKQFAWNCCWHELV